MRPSDSWRRRQFVVDGFQGRFIATQLGWLALFLCAFAFVLFAPQAYVLLGSDTQQRLDAAVVFLSLHHRFWPAVGVVFAIATLVTVRQSHRIAGPLYRFRRVCDEVAAGHLFVTARVRRGDYLTQEAEAFEGMLLVLRTRLATAQAALAQAEEHLQAATAAAPSHELEAIRAIVARARHSLDAFELTAPPTAPSPSSTDSQP